MTLKLGSGSVDALWRPIIHQLQNTIVILGQDKYNRVEL